MVIQVGVNYVEKSVHLEEEHFDFGQLLIEQVSDPEPSHYDHQSLECYFCIVKNHNEETSNVVHPLTVFDLRIVESVSTKHV